MDCDICKHADEHGSWPSQLLNAGATHCGQVDDACHRTWRGTAQSHCTACHRHFGSNSAGDSHRFGDYRGGGTPVCRDPKGFDRWETPEGIIWGGRDPELKRATAKRASLARTGAVGDGEAKAPSS